MKYYSLLKSTATSDILSIPVKEVIIRFSLDGMMAILKPRVYRNGTFKPKYETIGELLALGKDGAYDLIAQSNLSREQIDDAIYGVEEGLASIGLKFEDSDFTVGDVRVKQLGLSEDILSALSKSKRPVKTIDDLAIFGKDRFLSIAGEDGEKKLRKVNYAMEKFGMKMEGSGFVIDRRRQFPLNAFEKYLSPETKEKYSIGSAKAEPSAKKSSVMTIEELKQLDMDDLLEQPVSVLGFMGKIVARLEEIGIETLDDMTQKGYRVYTNFGPVAYAKFKEKLASVGLKFIGANYEISDGKVIAGASIKPYLSEYAKEPFDFMAASDSQKEEFMRMPIRKFGFSASIYNAICDEYKTMGDLYEAAKHKNLRVQKGVSVLIKACFKLYNIQFDNNQSASQGNNTWFIDRKELENVVKFDDLDEAGKQERLNQKLTESALEPTFAQRICDSLGISTVGELHSKSRTEIREALGERGYKFVCQFLASQGLKLAMEKSWQNNFVARDVVDVKALDEKAQEEFLSSPLTRLGLTWNVALMLREKNGISTIGDLTKYTYRRLNELPFKAVIKQAARTFNLPLAVEEKSEEPEESRTLRMIKLAAQRERSLNTLYIPNMQGLSPSSDEAIERVKSTSIEDIGLNGKQIEILKNNQIFTVGEVLELTKTAFTSLVNNNCHVANKVQELVKPYGLGFRRYVPKRSASMDGGTRSQVPTRSSSLSGGTRRWALIRDLVPDEDAVKVIESRGIFSVGDAIRYTYKEISRKFEPNVAEALRSAIIGIGKDFKVENAIKEEEIIPLSTRIVTLDCDKHDMIRAISLDITKVEDFLNISSPTRRSIMTSCKSLFPVVRKILKQNGYDITQEGDVVKVEPSITGEREKRKIQRVYAQSLEDAEKTMSEQQKKALLKFENSGLHDITIKRLEEANIHSLAELDGMQSSDVRDIVRNYKVDMWRIIQILKLNGMKVASKNESSKLIFDENGDVVCKVFEELGLEKAKEQPISAMGLATKYVERLNVVGIQTIGDFSKLKKIQIRKIVHAHNVGEYIIRVCDKYGVEFVNSSEKSMVELDKNSIRRDPSTGKTFKEMTDEEKQDFLQSPLSRIGIREKNCERLASMGIHTIKDLTEISYSELVKNGISEGSVIRIRGVLKELGIITPIYGASMSTKAPILDEDGHSSLEEFEGKSAMTMTDEEKRKFLSLPLSCFGITSKVVARFEDLSITTIGDILGRPHVFFRDNNFSETTYYSLMRTLEKYGFRESAKSFKDKSVDSMTDEEKQKFFGMPLTVFGISEPVAKRLEAVGISNVGDVANTRITKLTRNHFGRHTIAALSKILVSHGITWPTTIPISGKKVDEMSDVEKQQFWDIHISELGVTDMVAQRFEQLGIENLSDLMGSDEDQLRRNHIGVKTINLLKTFLADHGVTWLQPTEVKPKVEKKVKEEVITSRTRREAAKKLSAQLLERFEGKDYQKMTDEEKEAFVSLDIVCLGLSEENNKKLYENGIRTIEDLSNFSNSQLDAMTISGNALMEIRKFYRQHNMYRLNERIHEFKVEALDQYSVEEGQKLPIESLDLGAKHIERMHEAGVYKVEDLVKLSNAQMWGLNGGKRLVDYLTQVKEKFNVATVITPKQKMQEFFTAFGGKNFSGMTEEEQKQFLETPLEQIGLGRVSLEKLEKAGIRTIGDAQKSTYSTIKNAASSTVSEKIRGILGSVGLGFTAVPRGKSVQENSISVEEFKSLSQEEKAELITHPISEFGIFYANEKLGRSGIVTMKDLLEAEGNDLYGIVGHYGFGIITARCKQYGLKTKRRSNIKRDTLDSFERIPIDQMSEKERERLYSFSLKNLFSYRTAKSMQERGYSTVGDILLGDYIRFITLSRNNPSVRKVVEDICSRFSIDFVQGSNNNERISDESVRTFVDFGFDINTAIKLKNAGYETIDDISGATWQELRRQIGTRGYRRVKSVLATKSLELGSQDEQREPSLLEKLKARGVDLILELPVEYLKEGSEKRQELDEALAKYYAWWYETKVFTSANERLLLLSNQRLEAEKECAATNIEIALAQRSEEDSEGNQQDLDVAFAEEDKSDDDDENSKE